MRVVLAGILAVFGLCGLVAIVSSLDWFKPPTLLHLLIFSAAFILIILLSYYLFRPYVPSREELEKAGLIETTSHHAVRAFRIEDYNDEGPHYFVKLQDGSIMYFVGQYLYDYEPVYDGYMLCKPRNFPCTNFSIYRHKQHGYVVNLECRGKPLEPEVTYKIKEPISKLKQLFGHELQDGVIIAGWRYDVLRDLLQESSQ
ncbi:MAG: hypothetical protein RMJ88_14910 [Thermogemmata sp.]|nr:hypothetical protein [Thermogemmata sp.]